MRSSIVFAIRKLAVLVLILVIGMTSFASPASASEGEPFKIELAKEAAKAIVIFLAPPAVCLTADAIATTLFPPAAALAPYCATLAVPTGSTGAAISGAAGSIKIVHQAMAH
ncbi:MAG: hypothetical protein KME46_34065 [Brasilonema angustatum HA4187-MV1]|jgi:hypothetical protein|nr:hypothetical protein [Brasilonema angustatum HA4187-MV1]